MTPHTITHRWVPSAHTLAYTQRDTSIDGAHLTSPKGVLSAQIIKGAHYHIDRVITETPDYHP